jgi:phosphatidate phosphatase APP1
VRRWRRRILHLVLREVVTGLKDAEATKTRAEKTRETRETRARVAGLKEAASK